jgi:FMN phosphatase YigB (HAD superfamily)
VSEHGAAAVERRGSIVQQLVGRARGTVSVVSSAIQQSSDVELASFDLYDTVVVRSVGPERAVHHLVARAARAHPDIEFALSGDQYATARQDADRAASSTSAIPSLDEIHDRLAESLNLNRWCSAQLRELELQFELSSLVAVPGQVERLGAIRALGLRIAFTSDTHVGAQHLGPRLRELGVLRDDDVLLVSSDHGLSKARSGGLFDELVAHTGLEPSAIRHCGDNAWNDVTMPRRRGLGARLDRSAAPNRYEAMMADADDSTGLAALLAGACRVVRLRATQRGEPTGLTDVICGVAAPTMIGFALWVADRTRKHDLSHLWFLSRNGRIPFEAFRRLGPAVGCEVPNGYLRLSRDALRLASAGAVGVERWLQVGNATDSAFLTEFGERLTVDRLIGKLGLDPDADGPIFAEHGLRLDAPLPEADLPAWYTALDDQRILDRIESSSGVALDRLLRYLAHAGLEGHERLGMVDIGWSGQQSAMISAAVDGAAGARPVIQHLHLGATHRPPLLAPASIEPFLFEPGGAPVSNPVGLYELLSATSEPGMAGLRDMPDGSIEPVLRPSGPAERTAVAEPLRRLVVDVVEQLVGNLRPAHLDADLRPLLMELAARFWFEPTHEEATAWGALPWEVDSSGFIVRPFAEAITMGELPFTLRPGGLLGRQWSSGAVARSRQPIRSLLRGPVRRRSRRLIS